MVQIVTCENCNTNAPVSEVVRASGEYSDVYFCSESCLEDYNDDLRAQGMHELVRM